MNLQEFQKQCLKVAVYPNIGNNHIYTFLGLVGEFTEFFEKVETIGDTDIDCISQKKELGDVMWYFVMCCYELKINFNDLEVEQYGVFVSNRLKEALRMIGKLSELFKKQIRDDSILIKRQLEDCFGLIFIYLIEYTFYRGWDLEEILEMNIEKLQSRKERGVLHGSGDNR